MKTERPKLFTKKFMDELQKQATGVTLLQFLMSSQKKSFNEAIEEIALFLGLTPEYCENVELTCEEKLERLQDNFKRILDHLLEIKSEK